MALKDHIVTEVALDCEDGFLTRREAVHPLGLMGVTGAAAAALLAACGDDDDAAPDTTSAAASTSAAPSSTVARRRRPRRRPRLQGRRPSLARRPLARSSASPDRTVG